MRAAYNTPTAPLSSSKRLECHAASCGGEGYANRDGAYSRESVADIIGEPSVPASIERWRATARKRLFPRSARITDIGIGPDHLWLTAEAALPSTGGLRYSALRFDQKGHTLVINTGIGPSAATARARRAMAERW